MPKLPTRWEMYSNTGRVIPGTRFITFKVPLCEELCKCYPDELWFTPQVLLDSMREQGVSLGLVVDLTFTKRYYSEELFNDEGIEYEKVFVPGHHIPSNDIVWKFFSRVDKFFKSCTDKNKLVGVHCTHGVNRTGYCVARYMIEKLGMEPQEAIDAVGNARGFPIERDTYLEDLRHRSLETVPTEPTGRTENGTSNPAHHGRNQKPNDWHGNSNNHNRYYEDSGRQSEYQLYGDYSNSNGDNSIQNGGYYGRYDHYGNNGCYDDYGSYGYQYQPDNGKRRRTGNTEDSYQHQPDNGKRRRTGNTEDSYQHQPDNGKRRRTGNTEDRSIAGSGGCYDNGGAGYHGNWHGNQSAVGHDSPALPWGAGSYGGGNGYNSYNTRRRGNHSESSDKTCGHRSRGTSHRK